MSITNPDPAQADSASMDDQGVIPQPSKPTLVRKQSVEFAWAVGALIALVAASVWVYLPPYRSTFLSDDFKHFEFVRALLPDPMQWWRVFHPHWIGWYYRPLHHLFTLSAMTLFDANPLPYYVALAILHGLVMFALFGLALQLRFRPWAAFATALLFALSAPHWQVVGWISSFAVLSAALFTVLAVTLLSYALNTPTAVWSLMLVAPCTLLALFSREESLLLPLLMTWMVLTHPNQRWRERKYMFLTTILLAIGLCHAFVLATRPTWVFGGQQRSWSDVVGVLSFDAIAAFLQRIFASYSILGQAAAPLPLWGNGALLLIILAAAIVFYWRFPWGGQLALLWGVAGPAFVYIITQVTHSELSDRYLYLPWLGVTLAFGAVVSQAMTRWRRQSSWIVAVVLLLLSLNAAIQVVTIRQRQSTWLPEAAATLSTQQQLVRLLPSPPEDAHLFALRTTAYPDYFQAMAAVWYGRAFSWPGGGVSRLFARGEAGPNDYVFDTEADVLYDLMPELREHPHTWLLMQHAPLAATQAVDGARDPDGPGFIWEAMQVVGPPGERRLGITMEVPAAPGAWHALCYPVTIPPKATFRTAISGSGEAEGNTAGILQARVRFLPTGGAPGVLYDEEASVTPNQWTPITADLMAYAYADGELCLEVSPASAPSAESVLWANPRFTAASEETAQ